MARVNNRTIRIGAITLLILLAMLLRNLWRIAPKAANISSLRGLIYIGLFTVWGVSIRRRIIQTQVRRYLTAISGLMVFWVFVRTLKYQFFSGIHLGRYLWYCYYFPMLFIPLLALLVALSLGKSENFRLPGWANYLFLVSAALFISVLTNDLHQSAFDLSKGLLFYDNNDYSHGVFYFLSMGWIALCTVTAFVAMVAKCHIPGSRKRIYLPCIPLLALLIYNVLYVTAFDVIQVFAGDMTVASCLLITATLESCIRCGLIQSNTHYNELFRNSGIHAVITDNAYDTQYATASALKLSKTQMREAENKTVELDKDTILESMPLGEGHILWLEDVSELRRLRQNLESNAALLSKEAELLSEEVRQKEEKAVTDVRNRLYDTVAHEIAPQIAEINLLISQRSADTETRKKTLKKICVLGAYVKRRCNLIFLNEQQKIISSMELYNCLQESAEYILQYGVPCSVDNISQSNVPIENAKLAYDYFEAVVENALETLTAFSVRIIAVEGELVLKLMAECAGVSSIASDLRSRIGQTGGEIKTDYGDGVWYGTLTIPEGGAV